MNLPVRAVPYGGEEEYNRPFMGLWQPAVWCWCGNTDDLVPHGDEFRCWLHREAHV